MESKTSNYVIHKQKNVEVKHSAVLIYQSSVKLLRRHKDSRTLRKMHPLVTYL